MRINCTDIGKRFNRDWIFRHFNFEFSAGNSYAITGPNGSGKSTLLQVIAGAVTASEGKIVYTVKEKVVEPDDVFGKLSIATPYLELIEEMTLAEFLRFHQQFKPLLRGMEVRQVIGII